MTRRLSLTLAVVLALVTALAGCGGSDSGTKTSAGGATSVTLASLSVAQVAPLVLAKEKGIFEKHDINLTLKYVEAPAVIPTVLSKKAEFGYLNAPAVLGARSNGVPVKSVVTTSIVKGDPAQFPIQLMVPTKSKIATPADLKGKKIAVDTLFQIPDLALRNALLSSGVDPKGVKLVEIPYPQMGAALKSGQADAAQVTEPFGTILRSTGIAKDFLSAATGQEEGSPQSVLLASEAYVKGNPKVITNFRAAVKEATEYAVAHDADTRATLPSFTELPANLIKDIRFAPISTEDTAAGWQAWADLLEKVGAVKKPIDAKAAYVAN